MNQEKTKTLNYLKNTYCRLKVSGIHNVGVFAIRNIPKNKKVFEGLINQKWHKFKLTELKGLDKEILKMVDDFFVIEADGSVNIPRAGLNGMDMSFYVNHSEKPNLKTTDDGYTFVSLRPIKKGEELTVSYSTYDYKYKKS